MTIYPPIPWPLNSSLPLELFFQMQRSSPPSRRARSPEILTALLRQIPLQFSHAASRQDLFLLHLAGGSLSSRFEAIANPGLGHSVLWSGKALDFSAHLLHQTRLSSQASN